MIGEIISAKLSIAFLSRHIEIFEIIVVDDYESGWKAVF